MDDMTIPPALHRDIARAVAILRGEGCSEVLLFGSAARGRVGGRSDIDLAIRGCPRGKFFALLGRLLMELERPVDLVDLDSPDPFARFLEQEGELVRVG